MKIKIKENDSKHGILICLPLIVIRFAGRFIDTNNKELSSVDFTELYRELKRFKKTHHNFVLIEVKDKDGTYVKITL